MELIKLDGIEFKVEGLKVDKDETLLEVTFEVITVGEREFYITKETLGKKRLLFKNDDNKVEARVKVYSYQSPDTFYPDTEVKFSVELKEIDEDDDLSPLQSLAMDHLFTKLELTSLIRFCEEKGIFNEDEYEKYSHKYIKDNVYDNDFIEEYFNKIFDYKAKG